MKGQKTQRLCARCRKVPAYNARATYCRACAVEAVKEAHVRFVGLRPMGGLPEDEISFFADAVRKSGSIPMAVREIYGHARARNIGKLARHDSLLYVAIHDALADHHRSLADSRREQ